MHIREYLRIQFGPIYSSGGIKNKFGVIKFGIILLCISYKKSIRVITNYDYKNKHSFLKIMFKSFFKLVARLELTTAP